jgi:amino acid permease
MINRSIGAMLLVIGVTVGASALALPLSAAQFGFGLTLVLFGIMPVISNRYITPPLFKSESEC